MQSVRLADRSFFYRRDMMTSKPPTQQGMQARHARRPKGSSERRRSGKSVTPAVRGWPFAFLLASKVWLRFV